MNEIEKLYEFVLEGWEFDKDDEMYEDGDERAPFFSEAFLYNLLGKEHAKTVLAHVHAIVGKDEEYECGYNYKRGAWRWRG